MKYWYSQPGDGNDVFFGSEIRLTRNLSEFPFPCRLGTAAKTTINRVIYRALSEIIPELNYCTTEELPPVNAVALCERLAISADFTSVPGGAALVINSDESFTARLCYADHLRMYFRSPGCSLSEIFQNADLTDDRLNSILGFAFDKNLGFLTENPANLGTGMRASYIMHLPCISITDKTARLTANLEKLGIILRPIDGEGMDGSSYLYRLSNRITMGIDEKSAISNLESLAMQIATLERSCREGNDEFRRQIDDAYEYFNTAETVSYEDAAERLALIRCDTPSDKIPVINSLMLSTKPANMICIDTNLADKLLRDRTRAQIIKDNILH